MGELLKVTLASKPANSGLLIAGTFPGETPTTGRLPAAWSRALRSAARRKDWKARAGEVLAVGAPEAGGPVLSLHGLGSKERFDDRRLGRWLLKAVSSARAGGYDTLTLVLPTHRRLAGAATAASVFRRLDLAGYRFDRFRKQAPQRSLTVRLLVPVRREPAFRKGQSLARPMAEAVAAARDLANMPPNEATPQWMAAEARKLARSRKMKVRVLTESQLEKKGMGGILSVGRGSVNPPRLVRLSFGSGKESISIVGKGVTFDTGGISLKPPAAMDEMKFDKSGACVALGIARGAADLKLPYRFNVYLPLAENMPDGKSYRPGDIVRCYNGKTVEVLNTDAEGRMILADALTWACEEKPDVLLDFATLTGACVVALGHYGAGLFSPDEPLATELLGAGELSGERLWRLPLWEEFGREMKGRHADLRNTGSRGGGASTAAAFLAEFVSGAKAWAHLDIAGPAYVGAGGKGGFGSTGYGVALTLTWLLHRCGRL